MNNKKKIIGIIVLLILIIAVTVTIIIILTNSTTSFILVGSSFLEYIISDAVITASPNTNTIAPATTPLATEPAIGIAFNIDLATVVRIALLLVLL